MVLLKKTLQVEERYPYPVRLEAMYEVIDQSPMRKLEKLRQKGFIQKCKGAGVEGQVEEGTLTGLYTFSQVFSKTFSFFLSADVYAIMFVVFTAFKFSVYNCLFQLLFPQIEMFPSYLTLSTEQ